MTELTARIEAERERLCARYRAMPDAEVNRLARIRACFPKGQRAAWAARLDIKTNTLNHICQGRYFSSYELAVRMCEHYPETLTINDLVRVRAPEGVRLRRSDEARLAA